MLIPLRHEQMSARRWPVVTFALLALNILVFLFTHSAMEQEGAQLGVTKAHLLMLAASHPELQVPAGAQPLVQAFQQSQPDLWKRLQNPNREVEDAWDARMRLMESSYALQEEMDSLGQEYDRLASTSITEQYAFIPAEHKPLTYLTANFLHGGWLHLIGNMWFLWLAGFVLEDIWGRIAYAAFYLVAGVAALQFYAWTNAGSIVPTLGASGAIAALMGAFLVRFPTMKIDMAWIFFWRMRLYRFKMSAYWLLPLWLLLEVFYGMLSSNLGGVAHWAHVGGFLFGMAGALALRSTGLEHKLSQSIEAKVSVAADPEISRASDMIDINQCDDAIAILTRHAQGAPDSLDAWNLLQHAYWRKSDLPNYYAAARKVCEIHLKQREPEAAWHQFQDFLQSGGKREMFSAANWLEIGRAAENLGEFESALAEYEKLIAACPAERQALQAQLGAARICLKRLNRPQDALRYFEAAEASPIPHLDWEAAIQSGMKEARAAMAPPASSATAGA